MTDVAQEITAQRHTWGPDDIIFTDDAALVAAAEEHTGAMIALVPSAEGAERIAVDGGEDADQLHATSCYLGEAALIPQEVREQLVECVAECANRLTSVAARAFSISIFNPITAALSIGRETSCELDDTDYHTLIDELTAGGGPDSCVVLGITGSTVQRAYDVLAGDVYETLDLAGVDYPTPHSPWIPHITLLYTDDA